MVSFGDGGGRREDGDFWFGGHGGDDGEGQRGWVVMFLLSFFFSIPVGIARFGQCPAVEGMKRLGYP